MLICYDGVMNTFDSSPLLPTVDNLIYDVVAQTTKTYENFYETSGSFHALHSVDYMHPVFAEVFEFKMKPLRHNPTRMEIAVTADADELLKSIMDAPKHSAYRYEIKDGSKVFINDYDALVSGRGEAFDLSPIVTTYGIHSNSHYCETCGSSAEEYELTYSLLTGEVSGYLSMGCFSADLLESQFSVGESVTVDDLNAFVRAVADDKTRDFVTPKIYGNMDDWAREEEIAQWSSIKEWTVVEHAYDQVRGRTSMGDASLSRLARTRMGL